MARPNPDDLRAAIRPLYRADEAACVEALLPHAALPDELTARVTARARALVEHIRSHRREAGGLDAFLQTYALDTEEGVVLMCLAEALLRIPDEETANRLIRDKIGEAAWGKHLGESESLLVNASTWGLMLTGRFVRLRDAGEDDPWRLVQKAVARAGEPLIRQALTQAMRILSRQFVMGRTIEAALERAKPAEAKGYRHSYDMLGEAAHTAADAERYFQAYGAALDAIGAAAGDDRDMHTRPSISVKLSALYPRYEFAQSERVRAELGPRLLALARQAMSCGVGLTVDAEEADRLEPSLDLFEAVYEAPDWQGWEGFGMVVQAYLKRAPAVIDWLAALARREQRRIPLRLVKGAYWDSEVKRAQEGGFDGYPVFTRKAATDISFIACARLLIEAKDAFYPQFATHNAQALASILALAGDWRGYEFQRLHGMGQALYDGVLAADDIDVACRVYAPVGSHEDLLPYLVRRLLENGANTSFVNRLADDEAPIEAVIGDPVAAVGAAPYQPHPRIPLPAALYGAERTNAAGLDLSDPIALEALNAGLDEALQQSWQAAPMVAGEHCDGLAKPVIDPSDNRRHVGAVIEADGAAVERALAAAAAAAPDWSRTAAEQRAACLERLSDLLETHRAEAMALAVREAGKTLPDALAELREAVDFGRYYAARARADFAAPETLPGPTGEANSIALAGRGVFACISPWNFPLAIFAGQVAAALAAGNAVIAKPAEQTPLMAAFAVRLMHEAGVPPEVLHLLPGPGESLGAALVADPRIAGVAFTGSTETGRAIARILAARPGPLVPLIAETGGQNAMIVDSSALIEQVVTDVIESAFGSAGQRCSCLRVMFVQSDIAARFITMLRGAMQELAVGDPIRLATDVGPVIDAEARAALESHIARMKRDGTLHGQAPLPEETSHGTFIAPSAFEIDAIGQLEREVFGPILHIVRFAGDRLDGVIDAINGTGYGLTLGVHSRIDAVARHVAARARVGNIYVNRNMVGAVVGVQPFGGEGLSGTGPKAGGPRYLHRFATERTLAVNTVASGGNPELLSLADDAE